MSSLRLALKNWRTKTPRNSSFDPYKPECVQSSYAESLYINGDSASTLYAEINTPTSIEAPTATSALYPPNSYSAAPDPLVSSSGLSVLYNKMPKTSSSGKDGTYANNAYVVSEVSSEPNESSGGSTSTPSSAYYSDVSTTVEIHSSKRKKKKRKADDRVGNIRFAQSVKIGTFPASVSHPSPLAHSDATAPPIRATANQFPSESSLEAETQPPAPCEPVLAGILPLSNAPGLMQTQTTNVSSPPSLSCAHTTQPQIQGLSLCSYCQGLYTEQLTLRSKAEVPAQRPLPPLPSRQIQGPRKRVLDGKSQLERNLSAVPSEYI